MGEGKAQDHLIGHVSGQLLASVQSIAQVSHFALLIQSWKVQTGVDDFVSFRQATPEPFKSRGDGTNFVLIESMASYQ